jgi:sec-independent protein translocase protein TatB
MFGIGMPEMILILAVALIVIGPKKLPDLAKSLGKAMGEFKKATSDLKESMQIDSELKDLKTTFDDIEKDAKEPAKTVSEAADEAPVGAAEPVGLTDNGSQPDSTDDPLDNLKRAYGRHNTDHGNTDTSGSGDDVDRTDGQWEADRDGNSKTHKDV